jgi:shikimate kinase
MTKLRTLIPLVRTLDTRTVRPPRYEPPERSSASARGYGAEWRKRRAPFLKAHPWCRPCLQRNKRTPATIVDHIVPHRGNDALMWDERNWQPICQMCHAVKTVVEDGGLNSGATAHPEWLPVPACPVTLVTGPAGAGKSTYCKAHASAADMIVDLDECFAAVCGVHGHTAGHEHLGKALRLRNKLLATLAAKHKGRAYVIVSAPTSGEVRWWMGKLKAEHVFLDPGIDVCLSRLTPARQHIARKWYAKRMSNEWREPTARRKQA